MIFIRGRWIHLLSGLRTEVKTRDLWLNLLGTSNPLTEFTDIKHDFIIRECNFGLLFSVFRLIICQLCDYRVLCSMNKWLYLYRITAYLRRLKGFQICMHYSHRPLGPVHYKHTDDKPFPVQASRRQVNDHCIGSKVAGVGWGVTGEGNLSSNRCNTKLAFYTEGTWFKSVLCRVPLCVENSNRK